MSEKRRGSTKEERELQQLLESRKRLPIRVLRKKALAMTAVDAEPVSLVEKIVSATAENRQGTIFSVHKEV